MTQPIRAAIALDSWKVGIFERHLKTNGFTFERTDDVEHGVIILSVTTSKVDVLARVVKAAQTEAAKTGEGNVSNNTH